MTWLAVWLLTACAPVPEGAPAPSAAREAVPEPTALSTGFSVALSGRFQVVGGGAGVLVSERDPYTGAWGTPATIPAPDGAEHFGTAVALSDDWLAVSAPGQDVGADVDAGGVWMYRRDPHGCALGWCDPVLLTPETPIASGFLGNGGMAMTSDRLLVGGYAEPPSNSGAAYTFTLGGDCNETWCFEQRLSPGAGPDTWFGRAVAIADDRVAVGAENADTAYVFVPGDCGQPWCVDDFVTGSDTQPGDQLGASVAIDGDRLLVGARNAGGTGAVYEYARTEACGATWCERVRTPDPGGLSNGKFGSAVALWGDLAVVGRTGAATGAGDVRVLHRGASTWDPIGLLAAPVPAPSAGLGGAVAFQGDAALAGSVSGAAHRFDLMPRGAGPLRDWSQRPAARDGTLTPGEYQVYSVGQNAGFGGPLGASSRLYVDSGECGELVFGLQRGAGNLNDLVVIYLDTVPGQGISDLSTLTDTADASRRAISGLDGGNRSNLVFSDGFRPDFAIVVSPPHGIFLFGIVEFGPHAFVGTIGSAGSADQPFYEASTTLDALGTGPGEPIGYVATLISDTAFRSDEIHGADLPAGNVGYQSRTLGGFVRFVTASATGPDPGPDVLTVDEGGVATLDVASNDTDASPPVTLVGTFEAAHGVVTVEAGSARYTHDGSEAATDQFVVTVEDACGNTAQGTVDVVVTPVDDPPTLDGPAEITVDEDAVTAVTVTLTDVDATDVALRLVAGSGTVDLDDTALTVVDGAVGTGHVELTGPFADVVAALDTLTYRTATDSTAADTLTIAVDDGASVSGTPTAMLEIAVTVASIDDPPVLTTAGFAVDEGATFAITSAQVAASDVDTDVDALVFTLTAAPAHGTLSAGGTAIGQDGTFAGDASLSYAHDGGEEGTDAFTLTLADAGSTTGPTTVPITVVPVDDPTEAVDDAYTTPEDRALVVAAGSGVLANDVDPDGGSTVAVATGVAHGALTLAADGGFTYSPASDYNGADSFVYTVSPGGSTATVSLTVTAVDDAPTGGADAYTTAEDTPLVVAAPGVLGNDADRDGEALTAAVDAAPTHGTLSLAADGSFTYTPDANDNGSDAFTYRVTAGVLTSGAVSVALTVTSVQDDPVAADDPSYAVDADEVLTVAAAQGVLANDGDVDGDALTAVLGATTSHGTLTLQANGRFTYDPDDSYEGVDTFTYTASDGGRSSAPATVTITVTGETGDTEETGETDDTGAGDDTGSDDDGGCGCGGGGSSSFAALLPLLVLIRRRR